MQHADKIVDRIIFLDGFPNMQVLDPLHIGQNVKEVLDCDLAAEYSARALYQEAATHCHSVKDYVTRDLFEKLMHDEEEHIDFLETQLELVAKLGVELYSQHHIGKLDDSRRLSSIAFDPRWLAAHRSRVQRAARFARAISAARVIATCIRASRRQQLFVNEALLRAPSRATYRGIARARTRAR